MDWLPQQQCRYQWHVARMMLNAGLGMHGGRPLINMGLTMPSAAAQQLQQRVASAVISSLSGSLLNSCASHATACVVVL